MSKKSLCVGSAVGLVMLGMLSGMSYGTTTAWFNATKFMEVSSNGSFDNPSYVYSGVSWNTSPDHTRTVGLFQFDLSTIKAPVGKMTVVTNARLNGYVNYYNAFTDGFYKTTDGWSNATNWATLPAKGEEVAATLPTVIGSWLGGVDWTNDVRMATYVQSESNGDGVVSFYLQDIDAVGTQSHAFMKPWLAVDYSFVDVPEPVTMIFLTLGGLLGLRRKH